MFSIAVPVPHAANAPWTFRHGALQQPDFENYPEVVALQKTIVSDKNLLTRFFNSKIITGYEIINF